MKVELLYKGVQKLVTMPDSHRMESVRPRTVDVHVTDEKLVLNAIGAPIDSVSLQDFISSYKSFLIIVNDHARPTPTPKIIKVLLPFLENKEFKIVVASGTHKSPSEDNLRTLILGDFYDRLRNVTVFHDSKSGDFTTVGTTTRGTVVMLNGIINDFEGIIAINSIEPHYFAGFTGGRKSFLPGLAAYDTIEANHSMALLEESCIMNLESNPLHLDLEEAAQMVMQNHPIFAINVVLDGTGKIAGAFAGDIIKQLYVGAKLATEIYSPTIENEPDILIAVVNPPLDQNLYQAQKGFENCRMIVKSGGIMILIASCYDGIGPKDYAEMLQSGRTVEDLAKKFEQIKMNYQLGWHKVGSIPPFLVDKQLWMVSDIPKAVLSRMFIRGFSSIQDALDTAVREKGENASILIVEDSASVCPTLSIGLGNASC